MLIHQAGARQHVEKRRRGWVLSSRGGLDAGFVDMGEHRQAVLARQRGDAFEQFVRAALRRRRRQRPGLPRGGMQASPLDLRGDEVELVAGFAVGAGDALADRLRQVFRDERRNIEGGAIARRDGEHDADAGLLVGRQHRVDQGLVLRHQREKVLDGGDAVAELFGGADQRSQPHLLKGARTVACRIGMQRPDVERHFLEQALRHHVVRMVMGVDETRHDELARGIDDFDAGLRRQVWPDPLDPLAADQDIGLAPADGRRHRDRRRDRRGSECARPERCRSFHSSPGALARLRSIHLQLELLNQVAELDVILVQKRGQLLRACWIAPRSRGSPAPSR